MSTSAIHTVGTFDTKSAELGYLAETLSNAGVAVKTVDLATTGHASSADVSPEDIASHHPEGAEAVFTGDRGTAVAGMGWDRSGDSGYAVPAHWCSKSDGVNCRLRQRRTLCWTKRHHDDVLSH